MNVDDGLMEPNYFNNGGNPNYVFYYENGEEINGCPGGVKFEVIWSCDFGKCLPYCLDTTCYQYDECGHRMMIKSELACVIEDEFQTDVNMMKLVTATKNAMSMYRSVN